MSLYKSFCIELTDSLAYRCGLRTGDLIVRYGDWHYPSPRTAGGYYENILCWRTTTGINFVSGDVMMEDMQTLTFNVEADGLMRQRGLDGKFVVLQCNDWKYGMTNSKLSKALNGDDKGFRKIKLAQVQGESPNMILGPTRTIKFPEGVLGELRSYESLPESIFMEALRRSGR